ncbi:MAG: hypothetical protein ACR2LK_00890 [Solirubrobacteraceae bacterium]
MVEPALTHLLRHSEQFITRCRTEPRVALLAGLLLALAAWPSTASAERHGDRTIEDSRHLWATVNVCDPDDPPDSIGPDTIGIRASMPGLRKRREVMYMRFRVQYLSERDDRWHYVQGNGDSRWTKVGRALRRPRQSGRNFRLSPPDGATAIKLRGRVSFVWTRRGRIVRRASVRTTDGHRSRAGAFPRDYSEATCTIRS